jgi:hypothetical protein
VFAASRILGEGRQCLLPVGCLEQEGRVLPVGRWEWKAGCAASTIY